MNRTFLVCFILFFSFFPFVIFASISNGIPVSHISTSRKIVALSFDADMTPYMLEQLKQNKVKSWYNEAVIKVLNETKTPATLFLTGMWIETYPKVTKELSQNPLFELGNHSYSHGGFTAGCYKLPEISDEQDKLEINKTENLLTKYAVKHVMLFRFPGLCFDNFDLQIANKEGYKVVNGDASGMDGFEMDSNKIVNNVLKRVKPGSIIILHMHGGPYAPETATALPLIIKKLKKEGYEFVKVTDLLSQKLTTDLLDRN